MEKEYRGWKIEYKPIGISHNPRCPLCEGTYFATFNEDSLSASNRTEIERMIDIQINKEYGANLIN